MRFTGHSDTALVIRWPLVLTLLLMAVLMAHAARAADPEDQQHRTLQRTGLADRQKIRQPRSRDRANSGRLSLGGHAGRVGAL